MSRTGPGTSRSSTSRPTVSITSCREVEPGDDFIQQEGVREGGCGCGESAVVDLRGVLGDWPEGGRGEGGDGGDLSGAENGFLPVLVGFLSVVCRRDRREAVGRGRQVDVRLR